MIVARDPSDHPWRRHPLLLHIHIQHIIVQVVLVIIVVINHHELQLSTVQSSVVNEPDVSGSNVFDADIEHLDSVEHVDDGTAFDKGWLEFCPEGWVQADLEV